MSFKNKTFILILHGWNLDPRRYSALKEILEKEKFLCFIPAFSGHGQAPLPSKPYTLNNYLSELVSYLEKHKLKKCLIVGHSFGGRIAVKLASQYPQYVKKLILTGVPGYSSLSSIKKTFFLFLAKAGKILFLLPGLEKFADLAKRFLYKMTSSFDYYRAPQVMKKTLERVVEEDLEQYMKKISCPVMLVWGKQDTIVPLQTAEKMLSVIPEAKLKVIEEADHALPYNKSKIFWQAIKSFVRG